MDLSLCWTTTPKGVLLVKLIEPPLAEPHERWCERSKIPQKKEFSPTRFTSIYRKTAVGNSRFLHTLMHRKITNS